MRELGVEGVGLVARRGSSRPCGPSAAIVSATREIIWRTERSRCGVPSFPRKYFCATMFVAVCDQATGNSTSRCSKLGRVLAGDDGVAQLPLEPSIRVDARPRCSAGRCGSRADRVDRRLRSALRRCIDLGLRGSQLARLLAWLGDWVIRSNRCSFGIDGDQLALELLDVGEVPVDRRKAHVGDAVEIERSGAAQPRRCAPTGPRAGAARSDASTSIARPSTARAADRALRRTRARAPAAASRDRTAGGCRRA